MSLITTSGAIIASAVMSFPSQYTVPPQTTAITWTNLAPLTTTFKPPPSCSGRPFGALNVWDHRNRIPGWLTRSGDCNGFNDKAPEWLTCQPSGSAYSRLIDISSSFWWTYYSPDWHCPSGYTTVNALTLASSNVSAAQLDGEILRTTGTHVFCCPSGFTSSTYNCVSSVTTATSTNLCNDFGGDDYYWKSITPLNGQVTEVEVDTYTDPALPFVWNLPQQSITAEEWLHPVYMTHQQSDFDKKGLSFTAEIAIAVVVPIVVLLLDSRSRLGSHAPS